MTVQPTPRQFLPTIQRSAASAFAPIQREFNRLFDELGAGWDAFTEFELHPRMDVHETKDQIEISVELPGMDQADIKIEFDDDVLTISGEKKSSKEVKEENYRLSERSYGSFSRSITLPRSVIADKIKASMSHGVLKLVAPKNGETPAKQIRIQSEK